jgi:hypothetical protein
METREYRVISVFMFMMGWEMSSRISVLVAHYWNLMSTVPIENGTSSIIHS